MIGRDGRGVGVVISRRWTAGTAGLAVLVSVVVARPAAAETDVHRDARGDVLVDDVVSPTTTLGDITRIVTHHTDRALVVVVDLRAYPARGERLSTVGIETPTGRFLEAYNFRGRAFLVDVKNNPITCPGLRWHGSSRTDTITWVVPRSCIGAPDWVRTDTRLAGSRPGVGYAEDGAHNGPSRGIRTQGFSFGPRIYAG
jgi:hypothetical protein